MGEEKVGLTEVELAIMKVFPPFGQFNDKEIAHDLRLLADKLTLRKGEKICRNSLTGSHT